MEAEYVFFQETLYKVSVAYDPRDNHAIGTVAKGKQIGECLILVV